MTSSFFFSYYHEQHQTIAENKKEQCVSLESEASSGIKAKPPEAPGNLGWPQTPFKILLPPLSHAHTHAYTGSVSQKNGRTDG